jgi:hypothetical protein
MDNEINEMIERVLIQRNKTVDDMILGEIRKIATENGVDTIITLNDKAIIQALKNFAEVVRCRNCNHCEIVIDEFDNDWYFCKKTKDNAEVTADHFCGYGERKHYEK